MIIILTTPKPASGPGDLPVDVQTLRLAMTLVRAVQSNQNDSGNSDDVATNEIQHAEKQAHAEPLAPTDDAAD